MTVFLSHLLASQEHAVPIAIETNDRHYRGTIKHVSEEGGYVVVQPPRGFGGKVEASTILMTDIVSARLNG